MHTKLFYVNNKITTCIYVTKFDFNMPVHGKGDNLNTIEDRIIRIRHDRIVLMLTS